MLNAYVYDVLCYAGINVILAVSLNLVNGMTGQFSLGHAGFMAIGAYASAYLSTHLPVQTGVMGGTFLLLSLLLAGGALSAGAAVLVGIPSFRFRGDYLAVVTLGFGEIIRVVLLNLDAVGGARGMTGIPQYTSLGLIVCCAIATILFSRRIAKTPWGRAFRAVREDEAAAEAMGVDSFRAKLLAFASAAFFAGVAGALFAHQLQYLEPRSFDVNRSFEIAVMVVLGGSAGGAAVAALFMTLLREALRPLQELTHSDYRMVIYSLILIGVVIARAKARLRPRGRAAVPS